MAGKPHKYPVELSYAHDRMRGGRWWLFRPVNHLAIVPHPMPKMLSKNFAAYEFECPCGCGYGEMAPAHIDNLQRLRDSVGEPLKITSGIRCQAHNDSLKSIGAASRSWHIPRNGMCYACDITFATGSLSNQRMLRLSTMAEQLHFKGLGLYPRRIHVDSRPGRRARWINHHWNWKDI